MAGDSVGLYGSLETRMRSASLGSISLNGMRLLEGLRALGFPSETGVLIVSSRGYIGYHLSAPPTRLGSMTGLHTAQSDGSARVAASVHNALVPLYNCLGTKRAGTGRGVL